MGVPYTVVATSCGEVDLRLRMCRVGGHCDFLVDVWENSWMPLALVGEVN